MIQKIDHNTARSPVFSFVFLLVKMIPFLHEALAPAHTDVQMESVECCYEIKHCACVIHVE